MNAHQAREYLAGRHLVWLAVSFPNFVERERSGDRDVRLATQAQRVRAAITHVAAAAAARELPLVINADPAVFPTALYVTRGIGGTPPVIAVGRDGAVEQQMFRALARHVDVFVTLPPRHVPVRAPDPRLDWILSLSGIRMAFFAGGSTDIELAGDLALDQLGNVVCHALGATGPGALALQRRHGITMAGGRLELLSPLEGVSIGAAVEACFDYAPG